MHRIAPPPLGELVPIVNDRVAGRTVADVDAWIARLRVTRQLVGEPGPVEQVPGGLYARSVRVLGQPERRRRSRAPLVAGVLVAVVVLVGVAGWLLGPAIARALLPLLLMGLGLIVALLPVWVVLGRVGVCCPGLHCPGCRHH